MGLRKMESMGQMGNSEEATMSDDMPFDMADLIVVGGQGEPMEFAEGGFVPQRETLQTAAVPTMGGGTTGGTTTTPIVYDDFMKTPVVTMKEYRDANGNSIIITSVNGKATTAVPEGYTLYTPPANTAPSTTQAAIQTVNRRSYRPTQDGGEGPEPQPDQPAPDYGSMDDNDYFNAMAEQNSFGNKVGIAAATAIGFMLGGPVGLLVSTLMRNDKNNQIASMKGRIDGMQPGSAKDRAQAIYDEYRGETNPEKKQGLFSRVTDYLGGIVGDVAGAIGISQEDAAKVTQQAAGSAVSGGAATYDQKVNQARANIISPAQTATPAVQVEGMGSSLSPVVSPVLPTGIGGLTNQVDAPGAAFNFSSGPAGTIGYKTGQVDPRLAKAAAKDPKLTAIEGPTLNQSDAMQTRDQAQIALDKMSAANREQGIQQTGPRQPVGNILPTSSKDKSVTAEGEKVNPVSATSPLVTGPLQPAPSLDKVPDAQALGKKTGYDEAGVNKQPPSYAFIPKSKPVINPVSPQKATDRQDVLTDAGLKAQEVLSRPDESFLGAGANLLRTGYNNIIAGDKTRGYFDPVNEQIDAAVAGAKNTIVSAAVPSQPKPVDFSEYPSAGYDEAGVQMQDPRVPSNQQSLYTGGGEGYGTGQVDPRLAAAVQTQQAFNINNDPYGPSELSNAAMSGNVGFGLGDLPDELSGVPMSGNVGPTTPTTLNVEPRARSMYEYPVQETATQRRAREAATQRARIQTRNKEIASATSNIPARIANSKETLDAIKRGYIGSTTGGYAIGKISGSDGNDAGVVQRADGKVTKVRDLDSGATGQRAGMTVFSDADGVRFTKSTFGKKTKLNGDRYEGPGITQQDKGGTPATATSKQVTKEGVRYNTSDGSGGTPSVPADPPGNTGGFTGIRDMFDGGGPGESGEEEVERGGGDGGSSRVICTELYKQGKLDRELYRMDIVYTAKHLSPITVRGYHHWAIPMVVRMRSSTLLTNLFEYLTIARAKEIAHIVKPKEYKDRSVLGYLIKNIGEAICYSIGLFTDQKDWTVLYNKGAVK